MKSAVPEEPVVFLKPATALVGHGGAVVLPAMSREVHHEVELVAVVGRGGTGLSFAFLVLLAQLVRYDWRLDEAAMVFGARPWRCFFEVMLPNVWPAVLGAFLVSFILAFNNFEISFYNLGAIPTLPTIAWGTLRHGIEPELRAGLGGAAPPPGRRRPGAGRDADFDPRGLGL